MRKRGEKDLNGLKKKTSGRERIAREIEERETRIRRDRDATPTVRLIVFMIS